MEVKRKRPLLVLIATIILLCVGLPLLCARALPSSIGIPPQLEFAGTLDSDGSIDAFHMVIEDGIIYASDDEQEVLYSVDVREPSAPVILDRLDVPSGRHLVTSWPYLYLATEGGITAVDIEDPANLSRRADFRGVESIMALAMLEGDAYLASASYQGLSVFDVTNPNQLNLVSTFSLENELELPLYDWVFLTTKEHYLYLAVDSLESILIFDMTDPFSPMYLRMIPMEHGVDDVKLYENYLFIADGASNTIEMYDVSEPVFPERIKSHSLSLRVIVRNIAVNDTSWYAAGNARTGDNYIHQFNYADVGSWRNWLWQSSRTDKRITDMVADENGVYVLGFGELNVWTLGE